MMKLPGAFKQTTSEGVNPVTAAKALEGDLNTFWAVVDPLIIQEMIPRDLRASGTKAIAGITQPTKQAFDLFGTFDEATGYAQRMNKPLVVMEIKANSRVLPQLPLVQKIAG